jgi:hypothetical protein
MDGDWQPISTAPRDFEAIILVCSDIVADGEPARHIGNGIWASIKTAATILPTHWKPYNVKSP